MVPDFKQVQRISHSCDTEVISPGKGFCDILRFVPTWVGKNIRMTRKRRTHISITNDFMGLQYWMGRVYRWVFHMLVFVLPPEHWIHSLIPYRYYDI